MKALCSHVWEKFDPQFLCFWIICSCLQNTAQIWVWKLRWETDKSRLLRRPSQRMLSSWTTLHFSICIICAFPSSSSVKKWYPYVIVYSDRSTVVRNRRNLGVLNCMFVSEQGYYGYIEIGMETTSAFRTFSWNTFIFLHWVFSPFFFWELHTKCIRVQ